MADLCNRDFLRRYFLEPLESARIAAGIYVRPPSSTIDLDFALWDEILAHPRVKFVKDSSGSVEYRHHFVQVKARQPDLTLLTGDEFHVVAAMADGYDGCLMGTGILNAGLIGRAVDAWTAGDAAGRGSGRTAATNCCSISSAATSYRLAGRPEVRLAEARTVRKRVLALVLSVERRRPPAN